MVRRGFWLLAVAWALLVMGCHARVTFEWEIGAISPPAGGVVAEEGVE